MCQDHPLKTKGMGKLKEIQIKSKSVSILVFSRKQRFTCKHKYCQTNIQIFIVTYFKSNCLNATKSEKNNKM